MIDVGSQVICIKDDWILTDPALEKPTSQPVRGQVYTVVGISRALCVRCRNDHVWLELAEVSAGNVYRIEGFKPVRKTNIDVFKNIKVPPPGRPVRQREDA